jgi:hypothetical protein
MHYVSYRHNILPSKPTTSIFSNLGLPSDEEDDLDDLDDDLLWAENGRK